MRNAFGLMLMSVLAATLIATGGWFWTSHKSSATPQAFAAAQALTITNKHFRLGFLR